ncbi:MAG: carboxypeptidase regulatory-like domain-containing protein [Pyrinomonadaceae bacterium]|nr:carboxypeptidase regulatory-like domain-containing protein [Pyrinomonadaceae bacterium]
MRKNSIRLYLTAFLAFGSLFVAGLVADQTVSANRFYSGLVGGSPYTQDWSTLGNLNTNDDWDNIVSIQGFRGDGLTSSTGTDPQTIVADGHSTPLDVNVNQTNPDTFTTSGVTEFEITDPTVALKGSGTADAPHLMIYLNTQPCPVTKSISIRYNLRDLDGTARDAVMPVALQYRIGSTGNFINVPAGFVADATDPNTATKVTPVFVNLPPVIIGHPEVEIRIITANAAGTDEWVGVDDIEVGCYFTTAATVSAGGRVMTAEGNGISRARVTATDVNTLQTRFAVTNQFGYFSFDELDAGQVFLFSVSHRKFDFTNHTQAVQMNESTKGLIFYADAPSQFKSSSRGFGNKLPTKK